MTSTQHGPNRWTVRAQSVLCVVAVPLSVLVVHGVHLAKPLFWDDYLWYGASDHTGWVGDALSPHAGIYRPLVTFWFAGTRELFGFSPVAYHAFALAFLTAAAVMVRILGLRIGMDHVAATTSGVVYGSYGALTLMTIWVSSAGGAFAVACGIAAMVLLLRHVTLWRVVCAGLLFAGAVLTREASIVVPALMTIVLLMPRVGDPPRLGDVRSAVRKTAVLWLAAGTYLAVRVANGAPPRSGPYATELVGVHVLENARDLLQAADRFGVPLNTPVARIWDIVFWATITVASVIALKRRRYLPIVGLIWFVVSCLPVLVLRNHGSAPYYLDFALVGLALTLASLARVFIRSSRAIVAIAFCFVAVQVAAVQRIDDKSSINVAIRRSVAMRALAPSLTIRDHTLLVRTHCAKDPEVSKHGELFRVVRSEPDLEVRFDVRRPHRC